MSFHNEIAVKLIRRPDGKLHPIAPRNRLLRIFDDPNAEEDEDLANLGLNHFKRPQQGGDNEATMRQIDLNAVGGGGGGDGMIDLSAIDCTGGDDGIELPSADTFVSEYDEERSQAQQGGRTIRASYGAFQPMAHIDTNTNVMGRRHQTPTPTSHRHKSSYTSSRNMSIDSSSSSPSDFSPKFDDQSQSGSNSGSGSGKNKNVFEGSFAFRARGNSSTNSTVNSAVNSTATSAANSPQRSQRAGL